MSLNAGEAEITAHTPWAPESQPTLYAMFLKLPPFWAPRPAMWFAQVEAQFTTCNPLIEVDLTKYNYVVTSLDNIAAGEVETDLGTPSHKQVSCPQDCTNQGLW